MIAAFVIWSLCAVFFAVLAIRSRRMKTPAGVWANAPAPKVKDINAYNRAVSKIWWVFAAGFELLGIPLLFVQQNHPLILLMIPLLVALVIGAMIAFNRTEMKYRA